MEYSNLQVHGRFGRVKKKVALVAFFIGLGAAALVVFGGNSAAPVIEPFGPVEFAAMPHQVALRPPSLAARAAAARDFPGLRDVSARAGNIGMVPDMEKRNTMNLLLLGAASLPVAGLGIPFISFFVPNIGGGGSGGTIAKDALGNDVQVAKWIQDYPF